MVSPGLQAIMDRCDERSRLRRLEADRLHAFDLQVDTTGMDPHDVFRVLRWRREWFGWLGITNGMWMATAVSTEKLIESYKRLFTFLGVPATDLPFSTMATAVINSDAERAPRIEFELRRRGEWPILHDGA